MATATTTTTQTEFTVRPIETEMTTLGNLSWYEKKVYEYCISMNISELSRQSGISQKSLRLTFIKIKNKIKSEMEDDNEN